MRAHVFSPYAEIQLNGNFEFYGMINANSIDAIGTADIYSDEIESGFSTPTTSLSDFNYRLSRIQQRYR